MFFKGLFPGRRADSERRQDGDHQNPCRRYQHLHYRVLVSPVLPLALLMQPVQLAAVQPGAVGQIL